MIKEYLLFRKLIKLSQKIDINNNEKVTLDAFDKNILEKIRNNSFDNLAKMIISDEISYEEARWYKLAVLHILSYFRKYNITKENGK